MIENTDIKSVESNSAKKEARLNRTFKWDSSKECRQKKLARVTKKKTVDSKWSAVFGVRRLIT